MKLQQLNKEGFTQLRATWVGLLKAGHHAVFDAEYRQLFELIDTTGCWGNVKDCFNKPMYNVIVDSSGEIWAIVELVQTRNGSAVWVKMLDIFMSPKIEAEPDNEGNTKKRLEIFRAALIGIFDLTKGIKKADTVKVFGRTDALVTFLRGMHDSFSVINSLGTIKGIEVSIEGRWLVFRAT